jgi:transcriptional regulator with XRE-family HTH domain
MTKLNGYREFLQSVRSGVGYWKSYSLLQFTLSMTRLMKLDKISGRKLADKLDVSAQHVSNVLRGNENVTIETMAKYAQAVDAVVHIHVAKRGVKVDWVERVESSDVARAARSLVTPVRNADFDIESYAPALAEMAPIARRGAYQDNPVPVHIN